MMQTMMNIPFNVIKDLRSSDSFEDACISLFLVLFGGMMSGLTLGLMSLNLVELEVLQRSGTPQEQNQAAAIFPVVKKQHQLLVTLLLCNAIAMEALPVFLDNMFSTLVAVILSVTFVLAFGEIIPQAICSKYGLAIGANLGWLVRVLMVVCFPVSYPIGKLLDWLLGHNDAGLFRRAQLKAFVSIHAKEEGKGGDLTYNETTIINGALDLTSKTVAQAMTPIESTFSINVDSKLDWETLGRIFATGHSRIPVYCRNPRNFIGVLLVKSLITVRAEDEVPVSSVSIRQIPRVPADMPLYDILNEFQKGESHIAAVVKKNEHDLSASVVRKYEHDWSDSQVDETSSSSDSLATNLECSYDHWKITVDNGKSRFLSTLDKENFGGEKSKLLDTKKLTQAGSVCVDHHEKAAFSNGQQTPSFAKERSGHSQNQEGEVEHEVIGIITLEDVFEELIQEEILDETDEYIDVHRRIKVSSATMNPTTAIASTFLSRNSLPAAGSGNITLENERHFSKATASQGDTGQCPKPPDKAACLKETCGITEPLLDRG